MSESFGNPKPGRRRMRRGVIGVIQNGNRYLMIRRAFDVAKGGYWCFPGGHVEPGENSRRAIRRELAEELGIEAEPLERLGVVRVPDPGYILAVWRIGRVVGPLRLARDEIAEARWLSAADMRTITPSLPSNERVFEMLGL